MNRRAFLHVGQGKTGTSTIQRFMSKQRSALIEHGYLYPDLSGNQRHLELSLYGKGDRMVKSVDWWRIPWDSAEQLVSAVEVDLPAQIVASGCENVVLSDEALYRMRGAVRKVAAALEPVIDELVFVVYLRRQDEHVVSRYKQTMREGSSLLLSEFVARPLTLDTWQYDALLRTLVQDFPRARLVVRPYHRPGFRDGSLLHDFLDAIELTGFEGSVSEEHGSDYNTSYDAYTTEFLRRHNEGAGRADVQLRRQLTRLSDGPDLRMEQEEHRALWAQFLPGNERLVREFVPEAEQVFLSPPGPSRGITQAEVTDDDLARVAARLADLGSPGPR